jgi:hypothetical protein
MPFWQTVPVSDEPVLNLSSWRVFRLHDGDLHLVGINERNGEGRVSRAIDAIDPLSLVCASSSGRFYRLTGEPGCHSDADYVWQAWLAAYQIPSWTDETPEVWAAHRDATGATSTMPPAREPQS